MMERIHDDLYHSREPSPWIAAARTLAAEGQISENASLYLVEIFLECITFDAMEHDPEMLRLEAEMARIRHEHGLTEDEDFLLSEGPADWLALTKEWDLRDAEIRIARLRALGHADVAELMESRSEEFETRASEGHEEFWGPKEEGEVG